MNRARRGSATLVASNDCAFVAEACDSVIFLDRGPCSQTPRQSNCWPASVQPVAWSWISTAPRNRGWTSSSVLAGIDNAAYARGVVTVDLLDDTARSPR